MTDPVETNRQVAAAESDMEIMARLVTRLAIVSLDAEGQTEVARLMRDVSSFVLDAARAFFQMND